MTPQFFQLNSAQLSRGPNDCPHIFRSRAPLRHQGRGGNSLIGIPNFKSPRHYFSLFRQLLVFWRNHTLHMPRPQVYQSSSFSDEFSSFTPTPPPPPPLPPPPILRFTADLSHRRVRNLTAPEAVEAETVFFGCFFLVAAEDYTRI